MARIKAFKAHKNRYEDWFDNHREAYISELLAMQLYIPIDGKGLEIGIGTGRFAKPLGVGFGIDPCREMLATAAERGVICVEAIAESLPFSDDSFDYALIVTTICFVDSPDKMLSECSRVIKPGGRLIIGFIDRQSAMGQQYEIHKQENIFYKDATFYSTAEIENLLNKAKFKIIGRAQTLEHRLAATQIIEAVRTGTGQCAFVVIAAEKKTNSKANYCG